MASQSPDFKALKKILDIPPEMRVQARYCAKVGVDRGWLTSAPERLGSRITKGPPIGTSDARSIHDPVPRHLLPGLINGWPDRRMRGLTI